MRTDGDGLDLDTLLDMRSRRVVGLLVGEHRLAAERVDEGGPAYKQSAISTCAMPNRRPGRGCDSPVPEAPQTIKQNWMPFLTFFLRRIIFCPEYMLALQIRLPD